MCQVLNISGFWIFQESQYARVLNFRGYTRLTYFCKYIRVLNFPGLAVCSSFWISRLTQGLTIFVNMAGMQLWKGSEYSRILNMRGFFIYNKLFWLWLSYEHAWSKFHRVLNMSLVLNMPGLRIWPARDYARVTQGYEYAWISLKMP